MAITLNNVSALRELPQPEQEQVRNISYRANRNVTFEKNPQADTYEKKNTGKVVGGIIGALVVAAAVVGGICYHKGKPAEGETKKFIDCLKDGWKKLRGKEIKPETDIKTEADLKPGAEKPKEIKHEADKPKDIKPEADKPKEVKPEVEIKTDIPGKPGINPGDKVIYMVPKPSNPVRPYKIDMKEYEFLKNYKSFADIPEDVRVVKNAEGRVIRNVVQSDDKTLVQAFKYSPKTGKKINEISFWEDDINARFIDEFSPKTGKRLRSIWVRKDGKTVERVKEFHPETRKQLKDTGFYENGNVCAITEHSPITGKPIKGTHFREDGMTVENIMEFSPETGDTLRMYCFREDGKTLHKVYNTNARECLVFKEDGVTVDRVDIV